jgi:hypothetical protein
MSAPVLPSSDRRRVPPLGAFVEGWRRVLRAPAAVTGTLVTIWVSSRLVAVALSAPSGYVTMESFPATAGQWMVAFERELRNFTAVVTPDISPFFQTGAIPPAIIAATCVQTGLWLFLSGGLIDRFARARPIRTAAFFAAAGVYFFRFLRLVAIVWLVAWGLLRWQQAFSGSLVVRSAVLIAVAALGLVADFAKVRTVVEDRRSMLGAVAGAIRFVRRRPWRVLALALLNFLTLLAIVRILFQIDETSTPRWVSLLLSIGWILLGTAARLAFLASEVVFFQGELAHAGYTAAPLPTWPDSPAVEAMENLVKRLKD